MSEDGNGGAPSPATTRPRLRRLFRWILGCCLLILLILVPLLLLKTVRMESKQPTVSKVSVSLPDTGAMARRLAAAIQIPTLSDELTGVPPAPFLALHRHLEQSFPRVHSELQRETVAEFSLLYTWRGRNPQLPALLFAAHMDVVPASPEDWSHGPWSGAIVDGYVYGRGSLDDKVNVLGLLEAAEQLLSDGFVPERTMYFAFGHDEEVGGYKGAKVIAEVLASRGIELEAVVDEGMVITQGMLPGLDAPCALIGVAEKGFVNVELTVRGEGGHSSMPPPESAIGLLSRSVAQLEESPMPGSIAGAVDQMLAYVGPELPFSRKLVMANLWLFRPFVESSLEGKPATDALLRTTTAPTILQAGVKSNVLAQRARAVVNFRIKPGDTVEDVLAHVRRVVSNDGVAVRALESVEAQGSSSISSRMFSIMHRTIRRIDPTIVVAPGLMLAMTDSRHYQELAADIYRFSALRFGPEDLRRLHGVDERVSLENYAELVAFQLLLIRTASSRADSE